MIQIFRFSLKSKLSLSTYLYVYQFYYSLESSTINRNTQLIDTVPKHKIGQGERRGTTKTCKKDIQIIQIIKMKQNE
jgi:hypothetical protein